MKKIAHNTASRVFSFPPCPKQGQHHAVTPFLRVTVTCGAHLSTGITHDTYPRPEMLQVKNAQTCLFALLNQSSCRLALALNNGSFSSCIQTTCFGDRWDGPKQLQIQRAGARFQGILHEVCGADLRGNS